MSQFRKKPVVVEAAQVSALLWAASHDWESLPAWIRDAYEAGGILFEDRSVSVTTLEGTMLGEHDDWIIHGIAGEIYPCKPDIFAATYEAVE